MRTNVVGAVLVLTLGGCFLKDDGGGDPLNKEEEDTFAGGAEPMVLTQNLAVLADSFFAFDPTIDPVADALANAARIRDRMQDQLKGRDGGVGCGMVGLMGTTVTVDFGTGCEILSILEVSGSASATVEKIDATIKVTLTFTMLEVNGKDLDGTASFSTSNGTSFTVNANLTGPNGATLIANDLILRGTPDSIIVESGSMAARKNGATTTLTFFNVTWKLLECYPNSGRVQVKLLGVVQAFIFDAQTPKTGIVTVRVGPKTAKKSLPSYGKCPPQPPGMIG